jgi:hypothetical protein
MGHADWPAKAELYPTSATEFFLKVVDVQVTFLKTDAVITQLILHQNPGNMPARKIR